MFGCRSSRSCSCLSSNHLKCDQCGKSFSYNPDSVGKLGQHTFKSHWLNRIGHFIQADDCLENPDPFQVEWISNAKVNIKPLKQEDILDQYKTTFETWQDGPTELRCCQCGYIGPPYIRSQKNKVASSLFGHYLLMACWPLCFVPITTRSEITLYCRKCGSYFGCYDLDSGCLVPSCYSSHVSFKPPHRKECQRVSFQ